VWSPLALYTARKRRGMLKTSVESFWSRISCQMFTPAGASSVTFRACRCLFLQQGLPDRSSYQITSVQIIHQPSCHGNISETDPVGTELRWSFCSTITAQSEQISVVSSCGFLGMTRSWPMSRYTSLPMTLHDLRDRSLCNPEHLGNVLLARPGLARINDPIAQIWTQLTSHGC